MKLTISRAVLHAALTRIARAVEAQNTIPILSHVLIEAAPGRVNLTGTNLDIRVSVSIAADVETAGTLTTPAARLSKIVGALPANADVALQLDGAQLVLRSGRSRFKLVTLSVYDFPEFTGSEASATFALSPGSLLSLIKATEGCISTEETRYYLNGVFLHVLDDKLRGVATDGHRLALTSIDLPAGAESMPPIIVPQKAVSLIRSLADKIDGDIGVRVSPRDITLQFSDGVSLWSRLIDGTFPDYQRAIPQNGDKIIRVDRAALAAAVARVSAIGDRDTAVKLAVCQDYIKVSVRSSGEESHDEIETAYDGDLFEIGFNHRYLAGHLGVLSTDAVTMAIVDPSHPAVMRNEPADSTLLVVMPVRI